MTCETCVCTICARLMTCKRCQRKCSDVKQPIKSCAPRVKLHPVTCKGCGSIIDKGHTCPICGR